MRFMRNEDLAGWESVVAPGEDNEAGAGPSGPAGVSLLRVGNTALSLCTMTGRLTHAFIADAAGEAERALYELAFGRPLDAGRFRAVAGAVFDDTALPVPDRAALVRWAHLRDVLRSVDLRPDPVAGMLARVEYAVAGTDVYLLGPPGARLIALDRLADDLAAADIAIARFRAAGGAVDHVTGLVNERGLGSAVAMRLRGVRASLTTARQLTGVVSPGNDRFVDSVVEELGMSFRGTATVRRTGDRRLATEVRSSEPAPALRRWSTHGAADTASRAGWTAFQQSRAGVAAMTTTAQLIFAEACVAWWQLGSEFKAGWAWSLADQDEARVQLGAAGVGSCEPALTRVADSADLPATPDLLAPSLWMLVASVNRLLPAPGPDPRS